MHHALRTRARTHYPVGVGALSAPGQTIVTEITQADANNGLTAEDGQAIFKAAKGVTGGQSQYYKEMAIGLGIGALVGYLLGRAF